MNIPCLHPSDEELKRTFARLGFVAASPEMMPILRLAYRAAVVSDITILIEGETGTGKQVLSRAIHELDPKRCRFPFVTVHCSTLNESLAESELFGHQRGAFSGSVSDRKGLFRASNSGTLFLDDVNDLPVHLQAKLLDVVQRRVVRPLGSDEETSVDVRIVASSNRPLAPLVEQRLFRADLYQRLNVVTIRLPPLRDRRGDLPSLMLSLAGRHRCLYGPIESVEPELLLHLQSNSFPGNIRELENTVQRMLFVKTTGNSLCLADWKAHCPEDGAETREDPLKGAAEMVWKAITGRGLTYPGAIRQLEGRVLEMALRSADCTRRDLAESLGTSERTLFNKLRVHGLSRQTTNS
jgi:transcriptional regulator with GAF, ATPase, and Fis domain